MYSWICVGTQTLTLYICVGRSQGLFTKNYHFLAKILNNCFVARLKNTDVANPLLPMWNISPPLYLYKYFLLWTGRCFFVICATLVAGFYSLHLCLCLSVKVIKIIWVSSQLKLCNMQKTQMHFWQLLDFDFPVIHKWRRACQTQTLLDLVQWVYFMFYMVLSVCFALCFSKLKQSLPMRQSCWHFFKQLQTFQNCFLTLSG